MNNNTLILSLSIILAGILIALAITFSDWGSGSSTPSYSIPPVTINISEEELNLVINRFSGEGTTMGDSNAPIKMVEYSDYTCAFCGLYWRNILPLIKEKYIDTGLIFYEFRDYPVVGGRKPSLAANCANEQNSFWQYHNFLFYRYDQDKRYWQNNEIYGMYADILDLDFEGLIRCIEDERYSDRISISTREANIEGARGAPFFLINDRPVSGAVPIAIFEEIIEEELEFLGI